jgi:acetyl esterase/lipase
MHLDLFQPKRSGTFPAVILVHGGAWITGNHAMENPFAMELARRGYVAATISTGFRTGKVPSANPRSQGGS